MLRVCILRRKQGEQQIDRPIIHGVKIDGLVQTQENRPHPHQPPQSSVRQADAGADASRALSLPRQQRVKDFSGGYGEGRTRQICDRSQGLTLTVCAQAMSDTARLQPLVYVHG